MFNALAKRQLEKEVARLVQEKGAAWCLQSQLVQTDLLRGFPKQQNNVEALCLVVTTAVVAFLMSLPEPEADESALSRAVERARQGVADEKTAQWAVRCWATALAPVPHAERLEVLAQLKAQAEARRQAIAAEEERLRVEAVAEKERLRVEAEQQKRRRHLVECWRLAFPRELDAINNAAELAAQSQVRAASVALTHRSTSYDFGSDFGPSISEKAEDNRKLIAFKRHAFEQKDIAIEAEIWRRISVAPDQEALQLQLDEAWKVELQCRRDRAEQQRIEEEQRRQLQSEEAERRRVAQIEESNRQRVVNAEKKKQDKIREWRERFPLQCAGFNDEEVLLQIAKSKEGQK